MSTTSKYYPINEGAARRAKSAYSFSDYQDGSATMGYRQMVDRAAEIAEDIMEHSRLSVDYTIEDIAFEVACIANVFFEEI